MVMLLPANTVEMVAASVVLQPVTFTVNFVSPAVAFAVLREPVDTVGSNTIGAVELPLILTVQVCAFTSPLNCTVFAEAANADDDIMAREMKKS